MKLFKVLIVEDEPHAQTHLSGLLTQFPDLQVCGQAYSIDEAESLVKSCEPDLLFCDVELPPGNSLDWLSGYGSLPFDVIFTTSYDTFAIQAFRLSAVDYLLKPLDRAQLDVAVQRFRQRNTQEDRRENLTQLLSNLQQPQNLKKIALPTLSGFTFMTIDQIVRCESDNTYTTFYTADRKKMVVSRTLKECEQLLLEHGFFRIHNSHLINLHYIKEYIKGDGGQVKMDDGSVVDVSRRRKDEFLRWFR
jgi:two-component system LytT family response regulator